MERELAEMNVSLEQLAGLEDKEEEESGSSVHGSETCLREYQSLEYCSSKVRVLSLSCSGGGGGGGGWWVGEVCRSGEGMWDSAGNGTVGWHM